MPATIFPPRPVTPGPYDGVVVDARTVSLDFRRGPTNPDGLCLRVGIEVSDDAGAATVFDCASLDNPRRCAEVAASAGVDFDDGDIDRLARRLLGCQVRAVLRNISPAMGRQAGKPKAVVSSWISSAAPTPEENAHARRR